MSYEITIRGKTVKFDTAEELCEYRERMKSPRVVNSSLKRNKNITANTTESLPNAKKVRSLQDYIREK